MTSTVDTLVAAAVAEYMSKAEAAPAATPAEAAAPVEAAPTPVAPFVAPAGYVSFSSVFGAVPKNGDFAVKMCEPSEEMKPWVPKEDTDYVVQLEEAAQVVRGLMDNDKTLISGPTGSGKSSLVKYVCAKLNWPFIRINMTGDMDTSSFFGQLQVRSGTTYWVNGPMTDAVEHGAVVLVDEWEVSPPEIMMGMQNLLEDGGYLLLKEKPGTLLERTIHPHANNRLVYAGNTLGQGDDTGGFAGTFVQNTATIDRFTNVVIVDYLGRAHETSIIKNKTGMAKSTAYKLVQVAELVRRAYVQGKLGLTMSPRTLINWANKVQKYGSMETAFVSCFYNKLRTTDKTAVAEMYQKVFGVKPE